MKKKAIFNNILGAFSNFVFLFLTSIVLLPYYFKYINSLDYGIWLGGISFISLISVFEANISFILTQQLGEKWTNKKLIEFSKYFSAAMFFGIAVSILIIVLTFIFKDSITAWVSHNNQGDEKFSNSFFLYSVSLSLTIISGYVGSIPQVFLKTLRPPFFNILASILGIIYTVWAIPTQGIVAIASGNLVKSFTYTVLLSIYSIKILKLEKICFYFEFNYVLKLIKSIGFPFISKIGITLAVSIQNFIVASTISGTATTTFDITRKIPLMVQMFINIIAVSTFTSFSLFYSEQKTNEGRHEYTEKYFLLIRLLLLFSLTGVFLIGKDFVTIWVGLEKFGGNVLLGLICLTALTDQLRLLLAQQYTALGKFNLTSITDIIFAASFMISAYLLISLLKLNGIVLAGIVANITYFIVCYFIEKKYNLSMVSNIINKSFFYDLSIIIVVAVITKFIYEIYRGHYLIEITTILFSSSILFIAFYKKNKTLLNFLILKFGKSTNV
jgi:O-antigen/teichoic acid export membrane protein